MIHIIKNIRFIHTRPSLKQIANAPSEGQFVTGPNPYDTKKEQCIFCKHNIKVDYKNPRLISQFVSPLTGELYDKHITGLCIMQQTVLTREYKKSIKAMYMPRFYRDPKFNRDPLLFNPDRPKGKQY